tara:strand:- start:219 stop:752 length:534 start_codon:yes stop_codon:yes gene_type:complete
MESISKHISYKEATRSSTAKRYNIDNSPSEFQLKNMKMVAEECFEPLREHHGKALFVSSFLRSKALNEHPAIGGSTTSQHLQGLYSKLEEGAIDIDADVYNNGMDNSDIFYWLKDNVVFDQLIYEYPNRQGENSWTHVSYRKGANRNMMLIAYKTKDGRTKYDVYSKENLDKIVNSL